MMMKGRHDLQYATLKLVTEIYERAREGGVASLELLTAFKRSPSTHLLDRLMAFSVDPLYHEFRAALRRIETGSYGRCTICSGPIGMGDLVEFPVARYCAGCLATLGLDSVALAGGPGDSQRKAE